LPDFLKPGQKTAINTGGGFQSVNNSQMGLSQSGNSKTSTQGRNKKLKPYKSNQIRRMPENPTTVSSNNKFITDVSNGKIQQHKDQSQGNFIEVAQNHRF